MWHLYILDVVVTVCIVAAVAFLVLLGISWAAYYINEWKHRGD